MDVLRQLIQTIVVIVILAVFLEMLLPQGDMRRYVKMVMGLLIIVAVLQSVAGVINSDLLRDIPDVTEAPSGYHPVPLEDIMAAGQSLSDANRQEAAQQYSRGIARQVMSLAALNNDLQVVDASVQLHENTNEISGITVFCTSGVNQSPTPPSEDNAGPDGSGIQPVIISTPGADKPSGAGVQPTATEMQAASDIAGLVANFYNLQREQVHIEFQ
ncbi:MAG TPA: stage III sporulation protein AF [Desulfotomaculum sp.]|nr:stage III sporulation protein AF [Desulfotomaculum sp.]